MASPYSTKVAASGGRHGSIRSAICDVEGCAAGRASGCASQDSRSSCAGYFAVAENIEQSGNPMPLFTVTMRSSRSADQKDRLSTAIHAASIVAGYPEEDLFQRFLSLEPSDLRVDLYYPALSKPRSDQMLMIEVLVSSGTDTDRKKGLVVALVEELGEAGIDPNDIMVFFLETDRASGSFGGGRFAPPVALA
jgi:hypothetical protein